MAGLTIEFTEKPGTVHYTLSEINTLFADIATVLNAKLDQRDPTLTANLIANGVRVINVGRAVDAGDIVPYGQLQELAGVV